MLSAFLLLSLRIHHLTKSREHHGVGEKRKMARLIVVSNRVPSGGDGTCSGGLAVALESVFEECGGIWLGWSGKVVDEPGTRVTLCPRDTFQLETIDFSRQEYKGYYEQHANRCLWPLCHGRLDLMSFDHDNYDLYRQVNRRFADAVARSQGDDDMIWVHDYHLIPLGAELRRLGVTAPIGFFLHIPFPPPDVLSALPVHRELLEQLSAYDVLGFQTNGCLWNYSEAVERQGAIEGKPERALSAEVPTTAGSYPIGIDTRAFRGLATSAQVKGLCDRFAARTKGLQWVFGAERLDYTKGLSQRFLAFETLLDHWPALQGQLSLLQVAAPSRETVAEYRDMQFELEALSGRINARLNRVNWMPIHYLNRSLSQTHLAALYRISRIGLVTPLRDGMNLVAKEYIAAQDPEDPGVLVLSRFAGAAEELTNALLVNPYDTAGTARTIREALHMPLQERQQRWRKMMRHLERYDVHRWCQAFLRSLAATRRPAPMAEAAGAGIALTRQQSVGTAAFRRH